MMLKVILIFVITNTLSHLAWGAACCGGSSQLPAVITTDDRSQLSFSYSENLIRVESVDNNGFWCLANKKQKITTYKIDTAYVFDNDIQTGLSLPITQRDINEQKHFGLADIQFFLGYEYLPEREYNPYKPKGFAVLGIIIPTGKSKYNSEFGGADSRGQDLWGVSLTNVFVKSFVVIDLIQSTELHHYVNQRIETSFGSAQVRHAVGGQVSVGAGYNTTKSRYGVNATWFYEGPIKVDNAQFVDSGYIERYTTLGLGYSYMLSDLAGITLSYANQMWFGRPINTSLGEVVSLQFSYKMQR